MTMTGTTIPAGWYPDPLGTTAERWWDGSGWTAEERAPEPVVEAVRASAPVSGLPSRREVHARLASAPGDAPIDVAEAAPIAEAASAVAPVEHTPAAPETPADVAVPVEPAAPVGSATMSPALLAAALAVPAPAARRPAAATPAPGPSLAGVRGPTRIVAPPYQPVAATPTTNPAAARALVTAILAVATTVIMVVLHVGLQFRGISGAIGIVFAIQAMVAAHRSGIGWVRAVIALVISTIIGIIGVVSLLASLAGGVLGQDFATRIADEIRITDHAATVVCPATATPATGATFSCTETMPDGSAGSAVVTMTSPTSFSWRHEATPTTSS
jgi:hypothetical protein